MSTPATSAPATAAFFDLDRTLIAGSSAFVFGRAARDAGLVRTRDFLEDALRAVWFRLAGASDEVAEAARNRMLSAVTGVRHQDLVDLNDMVLPELLGLIRPEARALLEHHRAAGRETWIVSASPAEIVEPLAHALSMTGGIGTRGEVMDGVCTGRLDGPFCYGTGKAEAVSRLAYERGIDLTNSWAYSDSVSDVPMMEIVGNAVAVNPDQRLAELAAERGWPVVAFSRRSRMLVRRYGTLGAFAAGLLLAWSLGLRKGRQR